MNKMISLFKRDFSNRECPAYNEVSEGAEWVANGEGVATQKLDGTACMILNGVYYKRLHAKKHSPQDFLHWTLNETQRTGHGWVPVKDTSDNRWHLEANTYGLEDGTYELLGEKVQGNPEGIQGHRLVKHGSIVFEDCPRDYDGLKEWLSDKDIEGIVWHHADGRMVKLKKSDFGMPRKPNK